MKPTIVLMMLLVAYTINGIKLSEEVSDLDDIDDSAFVWVQSKSGKDSDKKEDKKDETKKVETKKEEKKEDDKKDLSDKKNGNDKEE